MFNQYKENPDVQGVKAYGTFKVLKLLSMIFLLILVFPIVLIAILIGIVCTYIKETWEKGLNWSKQEIGTIVIKQTMNKFFKE